MVDHHLEEQLEETLREGAGLTRAEQMLADALAEALRASRGGEGVPEGMVKGWRAGYLPTWELLVGLCACTRRASFSTS